VGGDAPSVEAYVGLGANLGDPRATLAEALARLDDPPDVVVAAWSSLYRTAPVGEVLDQPAFLNAVARLETSLPPRALLDRLLATESALGRVRDRRHGPRTCDLDLLLYDDAVLREPGLELPHPRLCERRFVLEPLLELAPGLRLPGGAGLAELLPATAGQAVERTALRLR
jgi:2-amino-4-hydroxy-6-hydroxymethyldihydropteridine diphosphokinase